MIAKSLSILVFVFLSESMGFVVADVVSIAMENPIAHQQRCTSRTFSRTEGGAMIVAPLFDDKNATDDDETDGVGDWDALYPFCPDGYYCDLSEETDKDGASFVLGLCRPCSGSFDACEPDPALTEGTGSEASTEYFMGQAVAAECKAQCGTETNTCSFTKPCSNGLFCNFENGIKGGRCEGCPVHMYFCENENRENLGQNLKNLTDDGVFACQSSCSVNCNPEGALRITEQAPETSDREEDTKAIDDVVILFGSPQMTATGPIVNCGLGLEPCEGAAGAVCFIERGKAPFSNKTINCYEGGGVAAVIYNVEAKCDNIDGTFNGRETFIPTVTLRHIDGKSILKQVAAMPEGTHLLATVEVGGIDRSPGDCWLGCTEGNECEGTDLECNFDNIEYGDCRATEFRVDCNQMFTDGLTGHLPCTSETEFCDFSKGRRGFCAQCPETDADCFFLDLNGQGATECVAKCFTSPVEQTELRSAPCKFCPRGQFEIGDVGDGYFSTEKDVEVETPCQFCAAKSEATCADVENWDMEYPYRTIEMFPDVYVECWAVAEFYRRMNIEADTPECASGRSWNYICGCSDSLGYAGAKTKKKQLMLEWFPRVGAILSILGSSFMIIGVLRDKQKRKRVIGELIIFLCCFDIIGSIAYAFTTLPTPKEDYILHSQGNEASCIAQGFFIQLGTISLYMNVSIAFYYLLIIQYSWRENRLRQSWAYSMLFVVPILVGAIFAFAGIPYYDNTVLWCNNSRSYWSEIPVMVAIAIATVIMINLCWFVYKSERASRRFRRHSENERESLSRAFFFQSMVYLGAFYLTWPAYLSLQLMIGYGKAFSSYGQFLFAGTALTLQGFWNFLFHTGLHYRTAVKELSRVWSTVRNSSIMQSSFLRNRSALFTPKSQVEEHVEEHVSKAPASENPPAL
ncbi:unnamed protein product [Pseudo-nitzschia multistriata]|uniref:PA domain-containing protein n=1 Tax=Pseudo-nitzschia multistriata TaxID=183589 RepID=A0A448ZMB7_9STRA|nr:unnamed protein product [Pseudo-nitzschia multistriata]